MQSKPVQIAIIVIGLLIGVVGIALALRGSGGPDLADKVVFVDVSTGDLYAVSTKNRSLMYPYRHPETNERTLFPATQDDQTGAWSLKSRYMGSLENVETISSKVDKETGKVDIPSDTKPQVID